MKSIKKRALFSIIIAVILWFIGYNLIGTTDTGIALAYIGAIIGGGCFWIGSRP